VVGAPGQEELAARYARSRGQIGEGFHIRTGPHPAGVTANLLVRRAAWEEVGGFQEGVRSGADLEFCWRVQDAGWRLLHRPSARVEHLHRERLRGMARKARRHAAGRAWVNRRYPGALPRPGALRPVARAGAGSLVFLARGERERALFKLIDLVWAGSMLAGYLAGDNRAERRPDEGISGVSGPIPAVLIADEYPERARVVGREAAGPIPVEARARPRVPDRALGRRSVTRFAEDDGPVVRLRSLCWLLLRHPLAVARDLTSDGAVPGGRPERLADLAPAARRIEAGGARRLTSAPDQASSVRAARLGRLLGLEVGQAEGSGTVTG
jgi:hypothetical protein